MPMSDPEKHGVSALGCRFIEKAEHVPIKKRRFFLRSPSPPPVTTSPPSKETEELAKTQDVSNRIAAFQVSSDVNLSQIVEKNSSIDAKISDKSSGRFCEDEDFSGISILAAAACSSSLGGDCGYAEYGSGVEESSAREVSTTTEVRSSSKGVLKEDLFNSSELSSGATSSCVPVGEPASISTSVNCFQEVATAGKGNNHASLETDSLTLSGDISCSKDKAMVGNQRHSSRDDRLHWDLNVAMDAWEQPFDDPSSQNDVQQNISHDTWKINHDDNMEFEDHDLGDKLVTACAEQSSLLPGEPKALAKENHDMDVCCKDNQPVSLGEKSLLSNSILDLDAVECVAEDAQCKRHQETVNPTDGVVVTALNYAPQPSASCNMNEVVDASVKSLNLNDEHLSDHPMIEGLNSRVGVSSCELENLGSAFASDATCGTMSADTSISFCVSSSSNTLREVMPNVAVSQNLEMSDGLHHEGIDLVENAELKTVESQDSQELAQVAVPHASVCSEAPNSAYTRLVGSDAAAELQEDYDSQYEDGEFREPSEHAWEKYDAVDREAEHVDCGLDCKETSIANPSDRHISESRSVEASQYERFEVGVVISSDDHEVDKELYRKAVKAIEDDKGDDEANKMKLSHEAKEKTEVTQQKELPESSNISSDMATGSVGDNGRKDRMPRRIDGLEDSGGTETRAEPKAFRRGLQSRIEGPVARDGSSREQRLNRMDTRYDSGSMRSFERVRYSFHNQGGGRQCDSWDGSPDSHRGLRRHYSPIIRGLSKLNDDAVMERDDIGCVGTQDDISYSHRLLPKSRAGANEEPCFGFRSPYKPDKKFNPERVAGFGRGRPFRFGPSAESRGRGRFNGPSPDETFQSSLKYRRPLSRREKSLSPFDGRGQSNMRHSRGMSPSRSRSRSPIIWHSPRGRAGAGNGGNTFLRHRSRSPNFRSEARMQRLRSPHKQPGFGAETGFRSIERSHDSPPRKRWSSARKDELGHFREFGYKQRTSDLQRSPGRMCLRGDRASIPDSPGNLKPDGYYRISDRISEDSAGRGVRYEENYKDRRKSYTLHPARRSYEDGMASRLHRHIDERVSVANSIRDKDASFFQGRGLRGADSRFGDLQRRFRGEQHAFMHERDGKFNSNSKQLGVDAMGSPLNLKSEQYRSNYSGRFTDMDGANRGCRFKNYEDRRKHYGQTNIMRGDDSEVTEKRMNHDVDENFPDTPEFCGRVTGGFDGRGGSLSTRSRDDESTVACGQEEKLDNSQLIGVQNSGDNDATKGIVPS